MSQGRSRLGQNTIPWGFFLALILLALAAVAAIFYRRSEDIRASEAESAAIEESIAASLAAEAETEAELPEFTLCDDPLILGAVTSYFDFRLDADVTSLLSLFGRQGVTGSDELYEQLAAEAQWIQGYSDITVYSAPCPEEGETLVLVTYVIDFRRTDEEAPGVMYCFVKEDGDLVTIRENPLKDELDFASRMLSGDFARGIIEETDEALRTALEANSTLALIYTSFLNGEIYLESGFDPAREQEVDVFADPLGSVLVGEEALEKAREEALEAQSIEESLAAEDVYR